MLIYIFACSLPLRSQKESGLLQIRSFFGAIDVLVLNVTSGMYLKPADKPVASVRLSDSLNTVVLMVTGPKKEKSGEQKPSEMNSAAKAEHGVVR